MAGLFGLLVSPLLVLLRSVNFFVIAPLAYLLHLLAFPIRFIVQLASAITSWSMNLLGSFDVVVYFLSTAVFVGGITGVTLHLSSSTVKKAFGLYTVSATTQDSRTARLSQKQPRSAGEQSIFLEPIDSTNRSLPEYRQQRLRRREESQLMPAADAKGYRPSGSPVPEWLDRHSDNLLGQTILEEENEDSSDF